MILGHGIDIVNIERINYVFKKYNTHFLNKILSESELKNMPNTNKEIVPFLAKHWAIKEAVSKAVGCGLINGSPLHFKDIVINKTFANMPIIDVTQNLLSITSQMYQLTENEIKKILFHVSTSGDAGVVIASVILEKNDNLN